MIPFVNYTDLKSFYGTTSRNSGSDGSSGPSTHESGNVAQSGKQKVLHSLETVQEMQAAENEDQPSHKHNVVLPLLKGNILILVGCSTIFAQNMQAVVSSEKFRV